MKDLETIFTGNLTHYKWKQLGQYLQRVQLEPGQGLRIDRSGSGMTVSKIPDPIYRRPQQPPFSLLQANKVLGSDPTQFEITLQEGWVITRKTDTDVDSLVYSEPFIQGQPMSNHPKPKLTVSDGDYVYLKFATDEFGILTEAPTIEVSSEEFESTHHSPSSGAQTYGTEGDYSIKLLKLEITTGNPKFICYLQGDYQHTRLWTGKNIGGARYIHKERDGAEDSYDFRTLEQVEPTGRTFGKVIVDFQNGDEFDDANDSIKFSAICERDTNPQITVDDDGLGALTIKGNNNDGTLSINGEVVATYVDGLWTSNSVDVDIDELPPGSLGDVLYHDGNQWVTLAPPLGPTAATGHHWLLASAGNAPYWLDSSTLP